MSSSSNIHWTDASWSPVTGCSRVSPGCQNCYAEYLTATRLRHHPKYAGLAVLNGTGEARWTNDIRLNRDELMVPLKWRKPRMIFVCSMSDLFHAGVPFEFIDKIFAVMALCPQHVFQVLTKRPERMAEYLNTPGRAGLIGAAPWNMPLPFHLASKYMVHDPVSPELSRMTAELVAKVDPDGSKAQVIREKRRQKWPLPNVWLGTSVEDQQRADERILWLLECPAAVRFLSCEPLLGAIDLHFPQPPGEWITLDDGAQVFDTSGPQIDWVIIGGESGRGARRFDIQWARDIIGQCQSSGVAVFMKQVGSNPDNGAQPDGVLIQADIKDSKGGDMDEWPEDLRVREFPMTLAAAAAAEGAGR